MSVKSCAAANNSVDGESVDGEVSADIWCIVPGGGKGKRMGADIPKQYLMIAGKTVAEHTLEKLCRVPQIREVIVAVAEDDSAWPALLARLSGKSSGKPSEKSPERPPEKIRRACAGKERVHSVLNALNAIADRAGADDWVMVHDIARPCVHPDDIARLIGQLQGNPWGGLLAAPVTDTLKRAAVDFSVAETIKRENVWRAFTPQMFRYGILIRAIESALAKGLIVTDESSAIEHIGGTVSLIEGRTDNIKITRPEDLLLAEFFLSHQGNTG
jgi:2-C-methyl-D-erythritol 4-phosphate cytidylyltransferase